MKEKLILVGGGGHCKSCIDVIKADNKFDIAGVIDLKEKIGQEVLGYKIIGSDLDIIDLISKYKFFLITLGFIESPNKRIELFNNILENGGEFPLIISPSAYISSSASFGKGTIIMHRTVVNSSANIGNNSIINTGAIVEHDSIIADHTHISTGSIVNGGCKIGKGVFIGSNAVISHSIQIPDYCVIGAGSVVVDSIDEKGTYVGNPVQRIG